MTINEKIHDLGEKLVKCKLHCEGIDNSPENYIIPRCLYLEKRNAGKTCIIIGINPQASPNREKQYYKTNGISYKTTDRYFQDNKYSIPFYKNARRLVTALGYDGDILWTELVKCQSSGRIPIETRRVCINRFLEKEIDLFKSDTIFSLGNITYEYCALRYINHRVIGAPHPNARGNIFNDLCDRIESDTDRFLKLIENKRDDNGDYGVVYLR